MSFSGVTQPTEMASIALLITRRPYLAQVFRDRCNTADVTAITCRSLDAGWRALMTVRADLLILDAGFPHDELHDFSRWYRADPWRKAIPVAALVPPNLRYCGGVFPLETRWQLQIPLSAGDLEKVLMEALAPAASSPRDSRLVRALADSCPHERPSGRRYGLLEESCAVSEAATPASRRRTRGDPGVAECAMCVGLFFSSFAAPVCAGLIG